MKTDYKETLNLPKTDFPMKANLTQQEIKMLDFWVKSNILKKMQAKDRSRSYILHDGPPYANGHIHIGHALNKILKDIIVKYKSMKGFYSPFIPGWDCHGLPIEHEVDKKLGSKKEGVSIIEKRKLCREYALKFLDIQRNEFKRLGVFGEWEEPYITMAYPYEASIVREFGRFVENGSVYKGKKPVHWCPSCVTALAEAEVEYADKESPSIYVKFRIEDQKNKNDIKRGMYFVIWTTTPWTLPANMALALHPHLPYAKVTTRDGEELIIAEQLIQNCMEKTGYKEGEYKTEGAWSGNDLEGIVCKHPWIDREVKTILGEHVTLEQGTGVVHTAPGHGEEDYEVGLKYGLDVFAPVDKKGCFTDEVKDFAGQYVFKANPLIIDKLREKQTLLGPDEKITHSYPHCWRCKKPVIFRATEQWFISMAKNNLRNKALAEIEKVRWIPKWGRDRIFGMVENRPDWCVSRQRMWGVPITLFKCEKCKEILTDKVVIDNIVKEVEESGADVWFEKSAKELLPQDYKCSKCGSQEFSKETDILDVWFDSGVSHAAVLEIDQRFPRVETGSERPADLYLEGSDQHRGWFQSSLLSSVGTRGRAPYKAVLTHGFVVDGSGKKMSKSLGNVVSPQEITDKYGAEILRLWSASADYREDMRISKEILDRLIEAYRKIRNTCRFLMGNIYDFDISRLNDKHYEEGLKKDLQDVDRFILSTLQTLTEKVEGAYENFEFHEVFHSIYQFCVTDMSAFYLDVLKDRLYTFKSDSRDRETAQWVLYKSLISLVKMMAPILSFTAEEIWQHLIKQGSGLPAGQAGGKSIRLVSEGQEDSSQYPVDSSQGKTNSLHITHNALQPFRGKVDTTRSRGQGEESIFLSSFPEVETEFIDKQLVEKWEDLRKIRDDVNKALEIKRQAKVIGNALEAKVILYAGEDAFRILEEHKAFLPTLFIVSSAEVIKDTNPPEGTYKSPEIAGLAIDVKRADGDKCGRCWNWSITVGKHDEFPELCERCCGVLKG
ncbi:MAG: isoleucine--tRNA ligase [Nitrospirae bacterium]|nr:isoleucine--tRNA ligase [Nitrospirota bacterium]